MAVGGAAAAALHVYNIDLSDFAIQDHFTLSPPPSSLSSSAASCKIVRLEFNAPLKVLGSVDSEGHACLWETAWHRSD